MKALVVDDEPVVLDLICRILKRVGIQTARAADAHEALILCEELKATLDIVISDVDMPGFSGLELADCIAASQFPVPVILMSGHIKSDPIVEHVFTTARLQEFNFIQKPFRPKDLLDEIAIVLGKRIIHPFSD